MARQRPLLTTTVRPTCRHDCTADDVMQPRCKLFSAVLAGLALLPNQGAFLSTLVYPGYAFCPGSGSRKAKLGTERNSLYLANSSTKLVKTQAAILSLAICSSIRRNSACRTAMRLILLEVNLEPVRAALLCCASSRF